MCVSSAKFVVSNITAFFPSSSFNTRNRLCDSASIPSGEFQRNMKKRFLTVVNLALRQRECAACIFDTVVLCFLNSRFAESARSARSVFMRKLLVRKIFQAVLVRMALCVRIQHRSVDYFVVCDLERFEIVLQRMANNNRFSADDFAHTLAHLLQRCGDVGKHLLCDARVARIVVLNLTLRTNELIEQNSAD